jgi:MoxR-like ATPase
MLDTHGHHSTLEDLEPVVDATDVNRMVDIAAGVHVAGAIKSYLVDLADATRNEPDLLLGASPRATLYMQRASRTNAATEGRDYVTPDDVKEMLHPVLNHRMILQPEAQMRGAGIASIIEDLSERVGVPGAKAEV